MQSTQQSSSLPPQLLAQLQAQVATLQSYLPGELANLANYEAQLATLQQQVAQANNVIMQNRHNVSTATTALDYYTTSLPTNTSEQTETDSKEINFWAYTHNGATHSAQLWEAYLEPENKRLEACKLRIASTRRRIEIIEWREECLEAFSNPSAIFSFPLPPILRDCKDVSHEDKPVCACSIRAAFYLLKRFATDVDLGAGEIGFAGERVLWNPLVFNGCDESVRESFKKMAKEVFVVLARMDIESRR